MPLPYDPTTNFRNSNGTDLGKILVTQDYVANVYPSLTQSSTGFIANPAELYLWGFGTSGQMGENLNLNRSTPKQEFTSSTNWKQISAGDQHASAIKTDGTLWTWGNNGSGQLADNTLNSRSTPRQEFTSSTNWMQVSSGSNYTLAIKTDGTLWAWGTGTSGQLGDNTTATTSRSTPRQISAGANGITGWKQVSAGGYRHSAAIRNDGTLWLWGTNNFGQLGDNTLISKLTPIQEFTSSNNWKQVVSASRHTIAIKNDGTLWCWGQNNFGQLGDGTNQSRSTPRQEFTSSTNWKQSSGGDYSLAIKTNGTLWGWGTNSEGQLGNNTILFRTIPTQEFTGSTNWKYVSGANDSTAAIKTDGTLWVWGRNNYGQLGDNTTGSSRSTPRQEFTSSTNWRQVDTGLFTAAIKFPIGQ